MGLLPPNLRVPSSEERWTLSVGAVSCLSGPTHQEPPAGPESVCVVSSASSHTGGLQGLFFFFLHEAIEL